MHSSLSAVVVEVVFFSAVEGLQLFQYVSFMFANLEGLQFKFLVADVKIAPLVCAGLCVRPARLVGNKKARNSTHVERSAFATQMRHICQRVVEFLISPFKGQQLKIVNGSLPCDICS